MRYASKYGFWELNPFPGCNQIVVSNHSFIYPQYRGVGIGSEEHKDRLKTIQGLGYDYVVCSVTEDNAAQKAILAKNGWKPLDEFFNTETGRRVCLFGKTITKDQTY